MRVRFTRKMGYFMPGETHDVPEPVAKRALRLNRAERVPSSVETATRTPPENAASRTKRPEEEPGVCGAELASGGHCRRSVTDGERCWQHEPET